MVTAKITFASAMKGIPTMTVLFLPPPYQNLPVLTTAQITVNASKAPVYVILLILVPPVTFSHSALTTVRTTVNASIPNSNATQATLA